MQKPQSGGKISVQIPGGVQGGEGYGKNWQLHIQVTWSKLSYLSNGNQTKLPLAEPCCLHATAPFSRFYFEKLVFFKTYLSSLGWNAYDIAEAEPFVVHKLKLLPLDTPL